ncbi:MAG: hypothetical protein QNK36_13765 [Colwellia sp.]|nr:hypothetical protein [Colwellia sp.]
MKPNSYIAGLLVAFFMSGEVYSSPVFSLPSLNVIKYQDSIRTTKGIDPEGVLYSLADSGDGEAQYYLASLLERENRGDSLLKAVNYYSLAYNNGEGRVYALQKIGEILNRNILLKKSHYATFVQLSSMLEVEKNFETTSVALSNYILFDELYADDYIKKILPLYKRACEENCIYELVEGKGLEKEGRYQEAINKYRSAAKVNHRALTFIYNILEGDKYKYFLDLAKDVLSEDAGYKKEFYVELANILSNETPPSGEAAYLGEVDQLLNIAIEMESMNALEILIDYAATYPGYYNPDFVENMITKLSVQSPQSAKFYRAKMYTVLEWGKAQPAKAKSLYEELVSEEYFEAYMGLGRLYSRGLLDEVDQNKAIEMYAQASNKNISAADHQMAIIYAYGRGMCRNYVKANAHASLALSNGISSSSNAFEYSKEQLNEAQLMLVQSLISDIVEKRSHEK